MKELQFANRQGGGGKMLLRLVLYWPVTGWEGMTYSLRLDLLKRRRTKLATELFHSPQDTDPTLHPPPEQLLGEVHSDFQVAAS